MIILWYQKSIRLESSHYKDESSSSMISSPVRSPSPAEPFFCLELSDSPPHWSIQPQDSKPQDSEPQDSKPQDKPQDSKPQDKPQDSKPRDSKPQGSEPQDSEPRDSEPQGGQRRKRKRSFLREELNEGFTVMSRLFEQKMVERDANYLGMCAKVMRLEEEITEQAADIQSLHSQTLVLQQLNQHQQNEIVALKADVVALSEKLVTGEINRMRLRDDNDEMRQQLLMHSRALQTLSRETLIFLDVENVDNDDSSTSLDFDN